MQAPPPLARLLIVDDEEAQMQALCSTLEVEGYAATGFTSAKQALALLREKEFDLVLTDLMMPEMDGITLLHEAQQIDRNLAGVMMTGQGTIDTAVKAMQAGALDYILKPFRLNAVLPVLARALATRRLRTENIQLREMISIYELCVAITHGLDLDTVIDQTLNAAFQQSDAGEVAVLLPASEGTALRVAGVRGPTVARLHGKLIAFDAAVAKWMAQASWELSDSEASQDPRSVFGHPLADFSAGIALPMVARGESAGVLCFATSRPQHRITLGQVKALNIVASTAGSALAAAILWEQLRAANRELEQRVRDRTAELEAANQELEAFSFSVSHDLRAPLRIVDGYCELIRRDYGAVVPSNARALLDEVCTGTRRMGQLIEDLLRFSRFARQPLEKKRLRLADSVASALRQVRTEMEAREVEIEVGDLHECSGDAALLEQVIVNLLANALKFTRSRARPHIAVGSFERDGEQVYFVRDNGVGFDMKHAGKLFGVFQRLHAQGDFEGTGIGLSIVHRIIQRHGGRVWAESQPDEGAAFYFTLPP